MATVKLPPVGHDPMVTSQSSSDDDRDDEISLLDLLIVLAKHKRLILGLPVLVGIIAAVMSLLMTKIYTGTTKILPPQQNQSTAAAMFGQLSSFAAGAGALGIRSPGDLYMGMLTSRTIADALVARFNLMVEYDAKRRSDARKVLENATTITSGRDGLITIEVTNKDPERAAALANAYVEELLKLTDVLAVTEAGQRRLFFERQLDQTKNNLLNAQIAARGALVQGGLAAVDAQSASMIQTGATMRARIAAKEVEIAAMRGFATEQNPEFDRARQELAALREQMAKVEGGESGARSATPNGNGSNEQGIRNVALVREVKYQEALFELLAKQYEIATLDEAREGAPVQIVDKAVVPDRRTSPKRTLFVLLAVLAAGFLAVLVAFVREGVDRVRRSPDNSERLAQLRRYLMGSRS